MIETYEQSRISLENLNTIFKTVSSEKFNEAKTRLQFIDTLLTKCLNWNIPDIDPEDAYEGHYSDYKLNLFRPVVVWEAKRIGNYFELPIGIKELYLPLKTLCKDNKNLKDALKQVSGYCHERGIQIGVVCNGWQLVAFVANRSDSVPPLEGTALVIPHLDIFEQNFREVWNCLSKQGTEENYLLRKLIGGNEKQLPPKLSASIYNYPGIKNRNPFQSEIEILSDLVLEDVIKEKEIEKDFLEECYCKSGALSQYSLVSKEILSTRYNYLFESSDRKASLIQVATKKGISPELVELFANSLSKRPILLIGDVGVGKSTFIDNLLLVEAPKIFEKSLTFKIDLGSKAIITLDIKKAILDLIEEQLEIKYKINIQDDDFVRNCYYVELETFKKNVRVKRLYEIDEAKAIEKEVEYLTELVDDKAQHLKRSIEFISKSQKRQVIIFIDNCDQRNDTDQESAFLIAQEFATDWPTIVFLCLRPETFHATKKALGALSGYNTKAFTIAPPRIDEVVDKRLAFAQKIASGQIVLSKLENTVTFSKLYDLIEVLRYSLNNNVDLYKFLDNISNGNIRNAIDLIKKFFGSGHVDTFKIVSIYNDSGKYTIPLHEILRAVIFGDNVYYSPNSSEIVNLFDVRHYDPKEHFIVPLILGLMFDYAQNNRFQGFVAVTEIYRYSQSFGYNTDQIDAALNFMYSKLLFETSQRGNKLITTNQELSLRISTSGIYHLTNLVNSFTYLDSIIVDVPIFDETIRESIVNTLDIDIRLTRAENFIHYLTSAWSKNNFSGSHFNWNRVSMEVENDIKKIRDKRG